MTPERWQQVKSTLAGALERDDTRERMSFLHQQCAGDTELERQVRSLLDQPTDQFDDCAATIGFASDQPAVSGNAGRRIGNYELLRELGRGGMGTVWLARRADSQFEKLVAVKLLKRGTDTDEVLRRFQAERQILARLEHPNIARLLDGGIADDDLPYFVMEYVEGVRLTDFMRERQPPLKQRLQLFLKICSAVQLAHQNLVVHRDLKPANILVTAEGEPKLLDFGIAKLLGTGGEVWEMTVAGRERLTPGYASPEQVRGEPVTTVSDVYSLGALLYEVLTERPAHRFGDREPTPSQVSVVICDEEPARPSLAAAAPEMRRQLRGDLDTIVLRAMAKQPARRYSAAGTLADDLRRYLEGRPVHARSDSAAYRARKFVTRNKTAVAAAVLVLAAVIAGAASTVWQARRAERRFDEVRKIANSFIFEFHDSIRDLPGSLAARQMITQRGVQYLDSLAAEAGNDHSLKKELAAAYERLGELTFDIGQGIETLRKAAALNESLVAAAPQNAQYAVELGESYRTLSDKLKIGGQSQPAIEYARRGLATVRSVYNRLPDHAETKLTLGHHYMTLGVALSDAGDFRAALDSELEATRVQESALAQEPESDHARRDVATTQGRISDLYADAGDLDRAVASSRRELEIKQAIFEAQPASRGHQRAFWMANLHVGRHLAARGEHQSALEHFTRGIEVIEGLSAADAGDAGHRRWVAVTYNEMGGVLAALGRKTEAQQSHDKAIAISEELARDDAVRVESRRDLVVMHTAAGRLLIDDNPDRAMEHFRRAETLGVALAEQDPANLRTRSSLAEARAALAACYSDRALRSGVTPVDRAADLRTARELYQRSLEDWRVVEGRGLLISRDAEKPQATARALAECDAALLAAR